MSGHSKWAQIKHKKAKEDAKRGQAFSKLTRALTVAAREGGGSPELNAALAQAIEKAKSYNMPHDNIERAIKRGTGEGGEAAFERAVYEGYGPAGVAIMVDVMTDNRNRAAADMRHTFSRHGGNLGATGSVAWMFDRKGHILVGKDGSPAEDELLDLVIEAGAEDMRAEDDQWEITTEPTEVAKVRESLQAHGVPVTVAEITMLPKNVVQLSKDEAKKVLRLMDALEDHDDVQEVYSNFDIPNEVLEEITAD